MRVVVKRRPGKLDREYHFLGFHAGAPSITTDPLTAEYIEPYSAAYYARLAAMKDDAPGAPAANTVAFALTEYRRERVETMKKDHRTATLHYVELIREKWGSLPIRLLEAKLFRRKLIAWRDDMKAKPRAADYALSTMKAFLDWLIDRGDIGINRAARIGKLHSADRANITIDEGELARQRAAASTEAGDAFLVLARTALRRKDVAISLTWPCYDAEKKILKLTPSKSITKRRPRGRLVVIPLTDDVAALFDRLKAGRDEKVVTPQILLTQYGRAWTPAAITRAWNRARTGFKGKPGTGVQAHLHDLRGKGISALYELGVEIDDLCTITGWSEDSVKEMLKTYVGDDAMIGRVLAAVRRRNAE
ncbi:MAG TPA: tyrosine-type recombinase/integrase [Caulobacterales bacterium]|nr:tyrosine-type recombinase/integrase [Caulobacterales bacterium]